MTETSDPRDSGPGRSDAGPPARAPEHLEGRPDRSPIGRARALRVLCGTGAAILAADLVTKQLALNYLSDREPVRLLGGAVYLTLTRNGGAAWSLGRDYTFIFPIVAVAVLTWIGWMAVRLRSLPWAIALGLVVGGVTGNLTDRLFRAPGPFVGHVVDMVSLFDPHGQVWPIFNVADSSLMVGVGLAVLLELTGRQRDGTRLTRQPASAKPGRGTGRDPDTQGLPD